MGLVGHQQGAIMTNRLSSTLTGFHIVAEMLESAQTFFLYWYVKWPYLAFKMFVIFPFTSVCCVWQNADISLFIQNQVLQFESILVCLLQISPFFPPLSSTWEAPDSAVHCC